jgi:hypothetical protein
MFRRETWWVWAIVILAVALIVTVVILFLSYRPPKEFVFATGRESGAYYALALEYQERLAEMGYTMTLLPTAGSVEILDRLQEGDAAVGFVQGGTAENTDVSELASLGSVFYEPLWVFYRPDAFDEPPLHLNEMQGLRIAVGEEGSGSALLARQLLADNGVTEENSTLVPVGAEASQELLHDGELDAVLFVLSPIAPLVRSFLTDPSLALLEIERTLAYHRLYPYLTTVTLGEGSIDLAENIPEMDRVLLASATSLVARDDISPDITRLLLSEAQEIHGGGGLLEEAGEFPSTKLVEIPMNPDASRFLEVGPTGLERYLPYWLASRLEWFIFVILPLLVLLYPLFRNIPVLYGNVIRLQIYRWYVDVRRVERQAPSFTIEQIEHEIDRLEDLHTFLTKSIRVPMFYLKEFYELRAHVNLVIERLEKRRQFLLANAEGNVTAAEELRAVDELGEATLEEIDEGVDSTTERVE